ncbi:MAG: hypothetical protein CM15mV117_290 [Caudoviricetes sp.]|nr:MAG: hypothetical protein CM15mV117_290 [Caudoviricetes sp.]
MIIEKNLAMGRKIANTNRITLQNNELQTEDVVLAKSKINETS